MANILVYIELEDGDATRASLSALNHGRRLASQLGAALYALLPCKAPPGWDENDIITVISRHGADKVILVTNPGLDIPPSAEVLGPVLANACKRFPPRVVLLPAAGMLQGHGEDLAGAVGGTLSTGEDLPDGDAEYLSPLLGRDTPLVVMLQADLEPEILGEDDTEVVVFQAPLDSPAGEEPADTEE